jgi:hypothetical protein
MSGERGHSAAADGMLPSVPMNTIRMMLRI